MANIEVSFYSEKLLIRYDPGMYPPRSVKISSSDIANFYRIVRQSNYQLLLDDLLQQKANLQLNDWFFYELMQTAVQKIFRHQQDYERELLCWVLLSQAGYDTRITFTPDRVFLCVFTDEKIFEAPLIKDGGRTYVNLTEIKKGIREQSSVYLLDFVANPKGKAFSFSLEHLPLLKAQPEKKLLKFFFRDSLYRIQIEIDHTIIQLMEQYPFIDEREYLKAPMSDALTASLIPALAQRIQLMPTREAITFLTVFTRSAFKYMEDKEYFGHSKPMIPDEVLHYPFSDCEDRSALFYNLVKELLNVPMLIIAYPDHLTVAVSLPELNGDAIFYRGQRYYVCDPTGPANSMDIGSIPRELKGSPYEIIHHYNQR